MSEYDFDLSQLPRYIEDTNNVNNDTNNCIDAANNNNNNNNNNEMSIDNAVNIVPAVTFDDVIDVLDCDDDIADDNFQTNASDFLLF